MWALVVALWAEPSVAFDVALAADHTTRLLEGEQQRAFELGRAEAGARVAWTALAGEVRFEAVRSARPQSLFGVDGNSLVVRARRAHAGGEVAAGPVRLAAQAGLMGDALLDAVEPLDDLRDFTVLSAQERGLLDADLGARVRASAWDGRLALTVTMSNGEGANETEHNDGTNTAVTLEGTPLRGSFLGDSADLRVAGTWRDGSRGAGSVQDDRLAAAVVARARRGSVGVVWARADGFAERADREVIDWEVWITATVVPGWGGLVGRYTHTDLDAAAADAVRRQGSAGLFLEPDLGPEGRVRLYAVWSRRRFGVDAAPVAGVPEAFDEDLIQVRLALTLMGSAAEDR